MGITYASFKIRFQELNTITIEVFNSAYAGAYASININNFGTHADEVLNLATAHNVIMSRRNGSPGAIDSEKVGDLEISYSNSSKLTTGYGSTSYGQDLERLKRSIHKRPFTL